MLIPSKQLATLAGISVFALGLSGCDPCDPVANCPGDVPSMDVPNLDVVLSDVPVGCRIMSMSPATRLGRDNCGDSRCQWLGQLSHPSNAMSEHNGELSVGQETRVELRTATPSGSSTRYSDPNPFCTERGCLTAFQFDALNYTGLGGRDVFAAASDWTLVRVDRNSGVACELFRFARPLAELRPTSLLHLNGAYVWFTLEGGSPISHVHVWDEGAADRRRLFASDISRVVTAVGGRNNLAILNFNSVTMRSELWLSRAPFGTATRLIDSTEGISNLSADPEDPERVVYVEKRAGERCGTDLFYLDLRDAAPRPIRITNDTFTKGNPVIRGDRVAWLDLRNDAQGTGCLGERHDVYTILMKSLLNGGEPQEIFRSPTMFTPAHLGVRQLYLVFDFVRIAAVPLP